MLVSVANAEVVYSGSISPSDPTTWDYDTTVNIGNTADGMVAIDDGYSMTTGVAYLGYETNATGTFTMDDAGTMWEPRTVYVGYDGKGILNITNGATLSMENLAGSTSLQVANRAGSTGYVTIDGEGSTLSVERVYLAYAGNYAEVQVINGADMATTTTMVIGFNADSLMVVDGIGSTYESKNLSVGRNKAGILEITNGGLATSDMLIIDYNEDGDSSINMATGGMLALLGDADDSLADFFGLVSVDRGTDAINYWNNDASDWISLTTATAGEDYTLSYIDNGNLAGYTLLTVGETTVPEPTTVALLLSAIGAMILLRRCR